MNEQVSKTWGAIFAPPGRGSLLPGPSILVSTAPEWDDDDAYTLNVPPDTGQVAIVLANAGAGNVLTVALPTDKVCVGKIMLLAIDQSATACEVKVTGVLSPLGSDNAANGVYLLVGLMVANSVSWVPFAGTEIVTVT